MFRNKIAPPLITTALISLTATLIPGGWQWVLSVLRNIWLWFVGPITVPTWSILLLSALALAFAVSGLMVLFAKENKDFVDQYREDIFNGIRWRWGYHYNDITRLASFCPHCDIQIYARRAGPYRALDTVEYCCDDCNLSFGRFEGGQSEVEDRVILKIQQRLRREASKRINKAA